MTKTYNNYEDLITFTRASKGHALRPVSYGDELVTNGTFESDATGYTLLGCTLATDSSDPYEGSNSGLFTSTEATGRATQNFTTVVGRVYRLTAFGKYNSGDTGSIEILGVVENSSETHITSSDTDWKLMQYNFVATATEHQLRLRERGVNNDASFFVDNVSIKEVTFDESDGTLTLFEHPNNVPRVEYDADSNRLGLLVEESKTNLLRYSEDQTAVNWGNINVQNQTSPSATGPDGAQTATEIIANDQSGISLQAYVPYASITTTANTDYTISVFVKRSSGANAPNYLYINHDVSINGGVWFDLVNGTVATERSGFTGVIEDKGNGWYRCACSFDSGSDTFMQANFFFTENDASQSMPCFGQSLGFLYGAQFEEGAFPTSYIKTTGSTATRSADVASMNLTEFGYNHSEGTVVVDASFTIDPDGSSFPRVFEFNTGTSSIDRTLVFASESSNTLQASSFVNSVSQVAMQVKTSLTSSVSGKVAFAFADDDFAASDDGDAVLTDTSGSFEPSAKRDKVTFGGSGANASNNMNGHIKSFKYYPRRLTNAQLEDLSS